MNWGLVSTIAAMATMSSVGGGSGGIVIDLAQIQLWQGILALGTALGLSGAPWLTALAAGRLLFRADFIRQIEQLRQEHKERIDAQKLYYEALLVGKDQRYADLVQANEANALAAERERGRADRLTDAAFELSDVLQANTHVIQSVTEVAREVVNDEPRSG